MLILWLCANIYRSVKCKNPDSCKKKHIACLCKDSRKVITVLDNLAVALKSLKD